MPRSRPDVAAQPQWCDSIDPQLVRLSNIADLKALKIAAGGSHSACLLQAADFPHQVLTWGYNGSGQLGHGKRTYENELLPKPVHKITELVAGFADGDTVEVRHFFRELKVLWGGLFP